MSRILKEFWFTSELTEDIEKELSPDQLPRLFHLLIDNYLQNEEDYLNIEQLIVLSFNKIIPEKVRIKVSEHGLFFNEGFKFKISGSGNLNSLLETYENPLAVIERIKFIKTLKIIKKYEDICNLQIELSSTLDSFKIHKIEKVKLLTEENSENDKITYNFYYKIRSDSGHEFKLEDRDFFRDQLFLKKDEEIYLIPGGLYSALQYQKGKRKVPQEKAQKFINQPLNFIPSGTDLTFIDLSEYSERVKGFEYYKRSEEVKFNNFPLMRDSDGNLKLLIKTINNVEVPIPINAHELIRLRTNLEIELDKKDIQLREPIKLNEKYFIEPSIDNLEVIIFALELLKDKTKEEGLSKRTQIVAIVGAQNQKDIESNIKCIDLTKIELEKSIIDPAPDGFTGLQDHQVEGINWMLKNHFEKKGGVLLADDMGLGKTLQILITLSQIKIKSNIQRPILIVCPTVLMRNWNAEIEKFIKPDVFQNKVILHGKEVDKYLKSSNSKDWYKQFDLIITNYQTFSRYQQELLKIYYLVNIFDESQHIKNYETAQSRAARAVKSDFTICATGTPIENTLKDIWNQISCLNRPNNPLGEIEDFNLSDDETGAEELKNILKINTPDAVVLRRDKTLLKSKGILKDKIEHPPYTIKMSEYQERQESTIDGLDLLCSLKKLHFIQKLYQHETLITQLINELSADELIKKSPKLIKTLEIIDQYVKPKNEKVLIFTHFTEMQEILKKTLENRYGLNISIINGQTNVKGKELALRIIDKFHEKDGFNIMILSPLAAGAGLNITGANHVIHYGRWWNPAKEDQATDRAYRIGQTKEVHVYYPILINSTNSSFDLSLHNDVLNKKRILARNFLTPIPTAK